MHYPIEAAPPAPASDAGAEALFAAVLTELLGKADLGRYVLLDDFAHRLVATVDGLTRESTASRLWPVAPTSGRFTTEVIGDSTFIAASNAARYAPWVNLAASLDPVKVFAAYRRIYPLLQSAYEDLGYPGKYFNDRLIVVIDELLQTPVPRQPLAVRLIEAKGPIQPSRPWVRYEFVDPGYESRSAGQKVLLRIGSQNELRIQTGLAQLRALLARGGFRQTP
jgi:hypothetical protein